MDGPTTTSSVVRSALEKHETPARPGQGPFPTGETHEQKQLSRYKLKKDLYAVKENILDPYVLITAEERNAAITLAHRAGDIYVYHGDTQELVGPGGEVGVGDDGPNPELWEAWRGGGRPAGPPFPPHGRHGRRGMRLPTT